MALNVISNFAANVAHRNLTTTDMQATSSLAKLSSGSRVVSAKDDAAAMAIGSRISSEVSALRQASINAGQASSMLQIADGAMARVGDILTRMKTLAVQSGSDQVSGTERGMLDTEYQSLLAEIDRIAEDTEFNGNGLVRGTTATDTVLNGLGATPNRVQAADGFAKIQMSPSVGNAAVTFTYDNGTRTLTATNHATGESQGVALAAGAIAVNTVEAVNFDQLGVKVELNASFDKTAGFAQGGTVVAASAGAGAVEAGSIRLLDVTNASATTALSGLASNTVTISGADSASATLTVGGFSAAGVNLSATGTKTVTLSNGTDSIQVSFNVTTGFNDAATAAGDGTFTVDALGSTAYGAVNANAASSFTFKLGTGNSATADEVTLSIGSITTNALSLDTTDIASSANADTAITAITAAVDTLNTARATVGASQNRLEFAAANLASTIENQEAARSALLDLDVAAEMTKFTSKQILMQAGVSMLAQANQMPQNLMRLFN